MNIAGSGVVAAGVIAAGALSLPGVLGAPEQAAPSPPGSRGSSNPSPGATADLRLARTATGAWVGSAAASGAPTDDRPGRTAP